MTTMENDWNKFCSLPILCVTTLLYSYTAFAVK